MESDNVVLQPGGCIVVAVTAPPGKLLILWIYPINTSFLQSTINKTLGNADDVPAIIKVTEYVRFF